MRLAYKTFTTTQMIKNKEDNKKNAHASNANDIKKKEQNNKLLGKN